MLRTSLLECKKRGEKLWTIPLRHCESILGAAHTIDMAGGGWCSYGEISSALEVEERVQGHEVRGDILGDL